MFLIIDSTASLLSLFRWIPSGASKALLLSLSPSLHLPLRDHSPPTCALLRLPYLRASLSATALTALNRPPESPPQFSLLFSAQRVGRGFCSAGRSFVRNNNSPCVPHKSQSASHSPRVSEWLPLNLVPSVLARISVVCGSCAVFHSPEVSAARRGGGGAVT